MCAHLHTGGVPPCTPASGFTISRVDCTGGTINAQVLCLCAECWTATALPIAMRTLHRQSQVAQQRLWASNNTRLTPSTTSRKPEFCNVHRHLLIIGVNRIAAF